MTSTAEALDLSTDVLMTGLTVGLLGFHWVLLPTFLLESIPVVDAAPTWTACISYVAWRRKQQGWFEPSLMQGAPDRMQRAPDRRI